MTINAIRNSIVSQHNKLIQELEIKYLNYINALLLQKASIHQTIQNSLYQKLFELNNIANTINKHSQISINTTHYDIQLSSPTLDEDIEIKDKLDNIIKQINTDNTEKNTTQTPQKLETNIKKTPSKNVTLSKPILCDTKQAQLFKIEGNKLFKQKKYQRAIVEYTKAINLDPSNAIFYSNRALAYTKLNHYEKAVTDAHKASEIDPTYIKAYVREAFAEFQLKNFEKAYDINKNALNRNSNLQNKKMYEQIKEQMKLCEERLKEININGETTEEETEIVIINNPKINEINISKTHCQKKLVNHINKTHKHNKCKVINTHNRKQLSEYILPYKCRKCGKGFKQNKQLKSHMKKHKGSKPYICSHCNKQFKNKKDLTKHIQQRHTVIIKTNGSMLQIFNSVYCCQECNVSFQTEIQLQQHKKQHKNICSNCNKLFKKKKDLTNHFVKCVADNKRNENDITVNTILTLSNQGQCFLYTYNIDAKNGNKFICKFAEDTGEKLCNKSFVQKCHLKRHCLESHVSKEMSYKYKCNYCDSKYKQKAQLKEHISLQHGNNVISFNCPYCNDTIFTRWSAVLRHCRTFHQGKSLPQKPISNKNNVVGNEDVNVKK